MKELKKKQDLFFLNLLETKKELAEDEIIARLSSLCIENLTGPFVVACVETDFGTDYQNKDERIDCFQKILRQQLKTNEINGYIIANGFGNFWIMIAEAKKVSDKLSLFRENTRSAFGNEVYIGVGRTVMHLSQLYISASEAQEVLEYRDRYESDGVINIEDIVRFTYRSRIGSNLSYQKVISCFIVGDLVNMETELNKLVEEIRYTPQVSKSSIRRTMIELTVNVLNIASNMNVDVDAILNGTDPYTWIISQGHTEVITAWFMELCKKLLNKMNEQRERSESGVIQQVCDYINENLSNCSLGLASASEYVALSSSYLSQLFKKETGIGLNAYITSKRMEKAKDLLRETEMKMDDIALAVGYNSTSYFMQVFKKENNISPNQYRKK